LIIASPIVCETFVQQNPASSGDFCAEHNLRISFKGERACRRTLYSPPLHYGLRLLKQLLVFPEVFPRQRYDLAPSHPAGLSTLGRETVLDGFLCLLLCQHDHRSAHAEA
jgi:hypothetical protein